jgi:hypothetical protein
MYDELKEIYATLLYYIANKREWKQSLPELIKGSIDEKAAESGHEVEEKI